MIGRVAIVGHGVAPAMAALALHRALGRGGLQVEWIETPGEVSAHGVVAGLPNLQQFHRLLGIDEAALLRAAQGSFSLGQQYAGFSGGQSEFLHSYGPVGRPVGGLPFMQHWLKARASGLPAAFGDFAREGVAARNGRIRLADGAGAQATAYGYHLDARGYAAALRAQAVALGIAITADAAPVAIAEAGRVKSLKLSNGRMVEADLFIDATPDATLLSAIGDGDPADAAISGCDRLLLGTVPALRPLPLYSRVAAHKAGWAGLYPLQNRTGVVVAYDSALVSDDEAATLAGAPIADPEFLPLTTRQLRRPWTGNVLAMGGSGEPLAPLTLHRLQVAITHLVSLFPLNADAMPEADIYNEELAGWNARMREFEAAHYALNRRSGEPFWDDPRARPISPELDARISLFGARGMAAQYNQDSFAEDEWQAIFLGHGVVPRSWDPQVDRIDEQQVMADFRDQLMSIRADVTAMDTHEAALAKAMQR